MTRSVDVVAARFAEDLAWLRRVPRAMRVYVYNKGAPLAAPPRGASGPRVDALPNAGREAHTYLHHLVARYDDLADVTVFVQGRPFDHVPDLHQRLKRLATGAETVDGFRWLGFLVDRDDRTGSRLFQAWSKNPERRPLAMELFWRDVFGDAPCPAAFTFFGGAHFIVARDLVRQRPRAFYENALRVAAQLPDAAHCFERTWDRVFGVDGIPAEHRGNAMPLYLKPIRRLMAPPGDSLR